MLSGLTKGSVFWAWAFNFGHGRLMPSHISQKKIANLNAVRRLKMFLV